MKKIGIIFDMDGTLWDSAAEVADSWNEVIIEQYGREHVITIEDLHRVMGKTMDILAAELFPELEEEKRKQLLEACCEYEREYLREHGATLYPYLEETLKKIQENYPLFIVSNCQSGYIEAFLEHYHFEEYFEDIECFGNNGKKKGENIRRVVERNHLEQAIYIGDIQGDYDASKEAGVAFIHAAYGFGKIEENVARIQKLEELPEKVNRLETKL